MIDGQLLYAPNQYTKKCYSGTDFQMYSFLNLLYICQLQATPHLRAVIGLICLTQLHRLYRYQFPMSSLVCVLRNALCFNAWWVAWGLS